MFRFSKAFSAIVCTILLSAALWAQAPAAGPGGKNWKDRDEYDLYVSLSKETDANKQLELLKTWKEKYPKTDYLAERHQFYIAVYQKLGQPKNIISEANEMTSEDPKAFQGLYWITFLTPNLGDTSAGVLDDGEKAANGLLGVLPDFFAADKKPANMSDDQWKQAKDGTEAIAHKTLGWIALQKKDNEKAEAELTKSLELNPKQGEVSYSLATAVLNQKKPEKQALALYHFARAASYEGEGALNPAGRKQVQAYLEKIYNTYHGDKVGLPELEAQAKNQALPPPDFKLKSAAELALENEEKLKAENPQLALWLNVKSQLKAADGETYFASNMKGALIPKLKGTLISATPEAKPKTLVLGLEKADTPEITLKLDAPLSGPAPAGTVLEFEGVGSSFTKEPFMLTFDVEKAKVTGWPAAAAPAKAKPAKPAARHKPAAK